MSLWFALRGQTRSLVLFALFAGAALFLVAALPTLGFAQETPKPPEATPAEEEWVGWFFLRSIGAFFGIIFLLMSIGIVMLVVFLSMDLRMSDAVNPVFVEEFTNAINRKQLKQAYEMCKTDSSFLAQVLTGGMGRLQYGIEDAREAMFNQVDTVKASKEQLVTYLGVIGTTGPLLGLVGTVVGMIGAFKELGSAKNVDVPKLAGHISHALVVTLVGIGLSVPAIFFFSFFKNRLTIISHNTGNLADDLLTQMYHNSKKPDAAPATAGPGTAATGVQRR